MRREIAFFVTVIILIGLATAELVYLSSVFGNMQIQSQALYTAIMADEELTDAPAHIIQLDKLSARWNANRDNMLMIIPHIQSDEMTYRIVTLRENLHSRDYDMALVSIASINAYCEVMLNHYRPSIKTIL